VGAIIVQAMSNNQAREKGIEMILAESTPEQIIQALRNPDFAPERQQYAVVTIKYIDSPGKALNGFWPTIITAPKVDWLNMNKK
jgi:uncharacterized Ntn-hydrolase superfamily protein